jgi:RHS repeat-associated protein
MTETGSSTTTASICTLAYKFTGKERDAESGLDYFGARYYSSTMGRWMSPDWSAKEEPVPYAKLDNPQTLNLYGYVGNNPLSFADADGHEVDLTGSKDDKNTLQQRLTANASATDKNGTKESSLFQQTTDKNGKTTLTLNKDAAANYDGKHSDGYNLLTGAISAKGVITEQLTNSDTNVTTYDSKGNATVSLSRNVTAADSILPKKGLDGQNIPNPFQIIAGHETLGHAYPEIKGQDHSESHARHVENILRREQGLPLRDPNSN